MWEKCKNCWLKVLAFFEKNAYTEISGRTPTQTSEKLRKIKISKHLKRREPQIKIFNK